MADELPRLILITDWSRGEALLGLVERALLGGRGVAVQHRHPGATDRDFLAEGRALAEVCARHGAPLFVNRRLDVALLLDAHLHLPSSGLLPADVRPHLPKGRWVSAAVHDAAEAERARGADLALVSPAFAPLSKAGERPPLGPSGFAALAGKVSCPAYALGGVTPERLATLGPVPGAAVIGAVLDAADPAQATGALLAALAKPHAPGARG